MYVAENTYLQSQILSTRIPSLEGETHQNLRPICKFYCSQNYLSISKFQADSTKKWTSDLDSPLNVMPKYKIRVMELFLWPLEQVRYEL